LGFVAPKTDPTTQAGTSELVIIAVITVGVLLGIICLIGCIVCLCKRSCKKKKQRYVI